MQIYTDTRLEMSDRTNLVERNTPSPLQTLIHKDVPANTVKRQKTDPGYDSDLEYITSLYCWL